MDVRNDLTLNKNKLKKDTVELVENQIYDKMTKLFTDTRKRLGIKGGANIKEPIINYNDFNQDDNGNLTFTYKNKLRVWGISTRV